MGRRQSWLQARKYWIVDSNGHVRLRFQRCLRSEALSCAELLLHEYGSLTALSWPEVTRTQRREGERFDALTLRKAAHLINKPFTNLVDREQRFIKRAEYRARRAALFEGIPAQLYRQKAKAATASQGGIS